MDRSLYKDNVIARSDTSTQVQVSDEAISYYMGIASSPALRLRKAGLDTAEEHCLLD
jgi:hypothetical protein